jgi:hypothetical protein
MAPKWLTDAIIELHGEDPEYPGILAELNSCSQFPADLRTINRHYENWLAATAVEDLIKAIGMQRVLAGLIKNLDSDEDYIQQLKSDLEIALNNYLARYDEN